MSGAPITSTWGFLHEDPLNSSVAKVVLDLRTQESERGLQGRVESLGWGQKRLVNERPKKQLSVSRYLFLESSGIFLLVRSGHLVDLASLSADGMEKLEGPSEAIEPSGFYTRKLRTKESCHRVCGIAPHPGCTRRAS